MVHYVVAEVDAGPPIVTRELVMRADESYDQLEERMHQLGLHTSSIPMLVLIKLPRMACNR